MKENGKKLSLKYEKNVRNGEKKSALTIKNKKEHGKHSSETIIHERKLQNIQHWL